MSFQVFGSDQPPKRKNKSFKVEDNEGKYFSNIGEILEVLFFFGYRKPCLRQWCPAVVDVRSQAPRQCRHWRRPSIPQMEN